MYHYIAVALLFLYSSVVVAKQDPTCSLKGTTVIYTNGITTTSDKADDALRAIKRLSLNTKMDSKTTTFQLAYNYSETTYMDILEVIVQRLPKKYIESLKNASNSDPYSALMSFMQGESVETILRRTLMKWSREILLYFETRITNARTEAFNNSAKLIQRTAYGFKSFKNYRLRVLIACS